MPSPEQKSGDGNPLCQMFVLKPFFELGFTAGRDVLEDCEDAGQRNSHVGAHCGPTRIEVGRLAGSFPSVCSAACIATM